MGYSKSKLDKKDFLIIIFLGMFIGIIACAVLGFWVEGFDAPISYHAGDDFSIVNQIKQLTQERWLWSTDRLGAPYGQQVFDYPSFFLQNTEYLMIKFWALFTNSVPVIENLLYLSTFVFCGISAYLVLRKIGIIRYFAICGSVLYAFAPYLFGRGLEHYCLTACYFVPISIYLCYMTYVDEKLLTFDKSLFRYKTILIIIACMCIANNGIGYYPFFTCFLLCVTALCKLVETHDIKKIIPQIKIIVSIVFFMVVSLVPTIIYHYKNGVNNIAFRSVADAEVFGLKLTQLFIPMYTHGIGWITDLVNRYNLNMPLINENATAYLGIIGCIGFVIGLLFIWGNRISGDSGKLIFLFARLSLASVLVMSIGGFISLLTVVSQIYVMRGFNRISIYIMFCCITVVCISLQSLFDKIKVANYKKTVYVLAGVMTLFGLWDQTPTLWSDGSALRLNRSFWQNDDSFVKEIEDRLQEGDMVFQLPYHKYPEDGPVNSMTDYQLLVGYIHSDTLKWSFGGIKGREGDQWNEYVSHLDMQEMIETLISAGFKGIYVDKRAYTEEEYVELSENIENVLEEKAIQSEDGNLVFYNLYPYIRSHSELLNIEPLTIEDLEYPPYQYGDNIVFSIEGYNASNYVESGINDPEDGFSWTQGNSVVIKMTVENGKKGDSFNAFIELENIIGVQHVSVLVNGCKVSEQELKAGDDLNFSGEIGENGRIEVELQLPDCVSPMDLGLSNDTRELGLAIKNIIITGG